MPVKLISRDMVDRDTTGRLYIVETPGPVYHGRRRPHRGRATQSTPRLDLVEEGMPVALDIEGVLLPDETSIGKCGVGRVSIKNDQGKVVYDVFAHYPDNVNHRPPPQRLKLGVRYKDIMPVHGARPVSEILANAEKIFAKSGIVVCHACENEIHSVSARRVLTEDGESIDIYGFDLRQFTIHDTQMFEGYRDFGEGRQRKPRLAVLASAILGRDIQTEEHSSVEDAQATMDLFLQRREQLEASVGTKIGTSGTMAIPETIDGIMEASGWASVDGGSGWSTVDCDDGWNIVDRGTSRSAVHRDHLTNVWTQWRESPVAVTAPASKVVNVWSSNHVAAGNPAPEHVPSAQEITTLIEKTKIDTPVEEVVQADGLAVAAQEKIIAEKKVVIARSPDSRVAGPTWEDIVRAHGRKLLTKASR